MAGDCLIWSFAQISLFSLDRRIFLFFFSLSRPYLRDNKSLVKALITIATASLIFEYFSTRFRYVEIVIFIKLRKTDKILYILRVYRFIALFNFINKIIEKIIGERIAVIVKKYNLFS
jgi:hypothetical protein